MQEPLFAGPDLARGLSRGGMAGSFVLDFPAQDAPGRSLSHEAMDITAWLRLGLNQGASLMAPRRQSYYQGHGFLRWHITRQGPSDEHH